ncbi:MAG: hypothetical protein ACI8YQ_000048 [Polaribacter sp.]|jgi:hypothetical protein
MKIKIQKLLFSLLFCCTLVSQNVAQLHEPVLTGVEGQSLLNELVAQFKPGTIYNYAKARDTMFSKVYMFNDSLRGVYTGYTIYLDPNLDPTTTAFANGINTEHTYPRSLGADSGNAESDMHHLYATRENVNAERGNLPFGEVPDSQTAEWYYLGQSQTNIPGQNIDLFSERGAGVFEPREDHKGNVARAMFYFYTMYKAQADAEDPIFFEEQKEILCDWHLLDPVDQNEWTRNGLISIYQEGKKNPFIMDCTLAERSYCVAFNQPCSPAGPSSTADQFDNRFELYQNTPNPFYSSTNISYRLDQSFQVRLNLYDATGRLCRAIVNKEQGAGLHTVHLEASTLAKGMLYVYQLEVYDGSSYYIRSRKLLKL